MQPEYRDHLSSAHLKAQEKRDKEELSQHQSRKITRILEQIQEIWDTGRLEN
jgi:hypothetical protein